MHQLMKVDRDLCLIQDRAIRIEQAQVGDHTEWV